MPTTTAVFEFTPESSQEILAEKVAALDAKVKQPLQDFFDAHGITQDNRVSQTVDFATSRRTVVRSWPDLETATAWVAALNAAPTHDAYPGHVISAQVDPV